MEGAVVGVACTYGSIADQALDQIFGLPLIVSLAIFLLSALKSYDKLFFYGWFLLFVSYSLSAIGAHTARDTLIIDPLCPGRQILTFPSIPVFYSSSICTMIIALYWSKGTWFGWMPTIALGLLFLIVPIGLAWKSLATPLGVAVSLITGIVSTILFYIFMAAYVDWSIDFAVSVYPMKLLSLTVRPFLYQ